MLAYTCLRRQQILHRPTYVNTSKIVISTDNSTQCSYESNSLQLIQSSVYMEVLCFGWTSDPGIWRLSVECVRGFRCCNINQKTGGDYLAVPVNASLKSRFEQGSLLWKMMWTGREKVDLPVKTPVYPIWVSMCQVEELHNFFGCWITEYYLKCYRLRSAQLTFCRKKLNQLMFCF